MRIIKICFSLILIFSINSQTIDFSSNLQSGTGFTVEGDIITIKEYSGRTYSSYGYTTKDFKLIGTNIDKSIIVTSSVNLHLDSLTLASTGKITPIIIENNCEVNLELNGVSSLVDSSTNENKGIIYLKEGAKLKIYGGGTLNLMINNYFGIYGENSTYLEINGGTIKIISTETSAGGINIGKDISFNGPNLYYEAISGKNFGISAKNSLVINLVNLNINSGEGKNFQIGNEIIMNAGNLYLQSRADKSIEAGNSIIINGGLLNLETSGEKGIETKNSIYIKKGTFNINSLGGKGIYANKNIYLGVKDDNNSNLKINITSLDKGIEAKGIEIYSGIIDIKSKGDGIKISNDECKEEKCSGECTCYIKIYGGEIYINSEENGIDSNGDIFIAGGKLILYGASNGNYQPITQCGILKITNGTIFAGGAKINGGISDNTTQISLDYYKYIAANSLIQIYDNEKNKLILNITNPRDLEYLYFNYPFNFTVKINGIEIERSDTTVRTLVSSESEDYDHFESTNILKNTINENAINSENVKENIELSTIPKQKKENQTEGKIISTFPKKKNLRDLTTIPKSNIKTEKVKNGLEKTFISSIPNKNNNYEESQKTKSTFPNINKLNPIETKILSTYPKHKNQNQENEDIKSSILRTNFQNEISNIIEENKPSMEETIISDSIDSETSNEINNKEVVNDSDLNTNEEKSYNLNHFIKITNLIMITIGIILL